MSYYFETGSDQEQRQMVNELGWDAKEQLMENGTVEITVQGLFDTCNVECIPMSLLEDIDDSQYYCLEDITWDYKLNLVK